MQYKMYSIKDAKAELFGTPFCKLTPGLAEREFQQLVSDPSTPISKYPQDFDLWYVGDYDDNSGKITPRDTPEHIIKAIQLLPKN